MKKITIFFLLCLVLAVAQNTNKKINLKLASEPIKLDGIIEDVWLKADSAISFFQLQPQYGKEPKEKTVAKILADSENLYCLIISYGNPENFDIRTGIHDQANGDFVSLMLDTYNDKQSAYKFGVSVAGVKSDSRLIDDARNRDNTWDGIWFAETKVYSWGYVVEIQIPFKSVKYTKNETEWGIDFDRWSPNSNEDLYWCEYDQSEGQRVSKFGKLLLNGFVPTVEGLNLEIYPVGALKFDLEKNDKYKGKASAGLDIFYNPSPQLTYQLTVNPDFAQIEADPYDVNISRYESYFSEKRPFFTQGNEVFNPSGQERGSGFYKPLEFFYSRRIGSKLKDGSEIPLILGTKAFGRIDNLDYGGIVALTGEKEYSVDTNSYKENQSVFGVARIRKQIMDNSTIGMLFVGKNSNGNNYGVLDVDGAFRGANWQLAYQFARSFKNSEGDYAASIGYKKFTENWITLGKARYIGEKFDISQIGYVPWLGTASTTLLTGPMWFFEDSSLKNILLYFGTDFSYEKVDSYTDVSALFGFNMQFKSNWGYEINFSYGKAKDLEIKYDNYSLSLSSWFHTNPKWGGNINFNYSKTYNFARKYLASFISLYTGIQYRPSSSLEIGTSVNIWIENKPDGSTEEIYYNSRPFISLTPLNNMNFRLYVDNTLTKTSGKVLDVKIGFLFSYNFSPKSWIYLALNDVYDRSTEYDESKKILPNRLHLVDRAGVVKVKYLYYF